MCGHVSVFIKEKADKSISDKVRSSLDSIAHRGPDDSGIYIDEKMVMGFRRLSIIDLENGHQPFEKEGYVCNFNGEIYNFKEIRADLEEKEYKFETNSDTEVLLTNYIEKGEEAIYDYRGMFTFLIYNKQTNEVFGGRDFFGIKPLYYIENDELIAFASEYKALLTFIDNVEVDEQSLQEYLSFQYVPGNRTMIKEIKKAPKAHYFKIKDNRLSFYKYNSTEFRPSVKVDKNDIYTVISDSVNCHMISDVEVGTFLSGGVDSSIIAALASKENPNIKSFTLGFDVEGYDEIEVAKKTSEILDIDNIHINVTQKDYIDAINDVVDKFDDPVADPSAIGLYYLSKEASKHVKVVLSGEGADELFAGYNVYKEYYPLQLLRWLPDSIKNAIHIIANKMPNIKGKNYLLRATTNLNKRFIGNAKIFENEECKKVLVNYNHKNEFQNVVSDIYDESIKKGYDYITTMQNIDINTWLEGDILAKADKMSMASSIEVRVPFLDIEVLKAAERIPINQKVTRSKTKVLLRQAFDNIVPKHVVNRKKLGFPTPIRVWLKEDLGKVVRKTIISTNVDRYINKDYVLNLLDEHIDNKRDNSRKIWSIFIFCVWYNTYIESK